MAHKVYKADLFNVSAFGINLSFLTLEFVR
jgi:hypothetical protein